MASKPKYYLEDGLVGPIAQAKLDHLFNLIGGNSLTSSALDQLIGEVLRIRDETDADRETMFNQVATKLGLDYEVVYDAWLATPHYDENGNTL